MALFKFEDKLLKKARKQAELVEKLKPTFTELTDEQLVAKRTSTEKDTKREKLWTISCRRYSLKSERRAGASWGWSTLKFR